MMAGLDLGLGLARLTLRVTLEGVCSMYHNDHTNQGMNEHSYSSRGLFYSLLHLIILTANPLRGSK
jgi:hypothetical protein